MKKISLLLIVLLLFVSSSAYCAVYYIAADGNDSNNGTSTSTPWAHHPWDASATSTSASTVAAAGDEFLFQRGDTFSAVSLTIDEGGSGVGSEVTVGAYGTGDKPILANASSYVAFGSGAGDSHIIFQDLDLRGNFGTGVFIATSSVVNIQLLGSDVLNTGTGWGISYGSGATGVIDNCTIVVTGEGRGVNLEGATVTVTDNTITTLDDAESGDTTFVGLYLLNSAADCTVSDNTIGSETNSFYYGIRIDAATGLSITDNVLVGADNDGTGIRSISGTLSTSTIARNKVNGYTTGIHVANGGGDLKFVRNLIYGHAINGLNIEVDADGTGDTQILHNTVYHSPTGTNPRGHAFEIEDGKVEIRNNIVFIPSTFDPGSGLGAAGVQCIAYTAGYTSVKASNNNYYVDPTAITNGANIGKHAGTEYATLALLQTAINSDAAITGKETSSTEADPLFSSAINADFSLTSSSPIAAIGTYVAGHHNAVLGQRDIRKWFVAPFDALSAGAYHGTDWSTRGQIFVGN